MPGDRVRLDPQERLDIEDARALQALTYAYSQRMLADLLGAGAGCVSPFQYAYETDGAEFWINLQAFAFYHSKGELSRTQPGGVGQSDSSVYSTWQGGIVTFDPAKQSAKVDYTAARNAARAYASANAGTTPPPGTANALPWLWARPIWIDEDEDGRRKWSMDLRTEVPVTINTRERQRVSFALADTQPDAGGGEPWVKIGKVTSWAYASGAPNRAVFSRISMWDSQDLLNWTKETDGLFDDEQSGRTSVVGLLHTPAVSGEADAFADLAAYPGSHRDLGLVRVLYLMRNRLRRMGSKGTADPDNTPEKGWLFIPKYSLRGLQKLLDDVMIPKLASYGTVINNSVVNLLSASLGISSSPGAIGAGAGAAPGGFVWAKGRVNFTTIGGENVYVFEGTGATLEDPPPTGNNGENGPVYIRLKTIPGMFTSSHYSIACTLCPNDGHEEGIYTAAASHPMAYQVSEGLWRVHIIGSNGQQVSSGQSFYVTIFGSANLPTPVQV